MHVSTALRKYRARKITLAAFMRGVMQAERFGIYRVRTRNANLICTSDLVTEVHDKSMKSRSMRLKHYPTIKLTPYRTCMKTILQLRFP